MTMRAAAKLCGAASPLHVRQWLQQRAALRCAALQCDASMSAYVCVTCFALHSSSLSVLARRRARIWHSLS